MQHHWKTYREVTKRKMTEGVFASSSIEATVAAHATGVVGVENEFLQAPVTSGYSRTQESTTPNNNNQEDYFTGAHKRAASLSHDDPSAHDLQSPVYSIDRMVDPPPLDEALVTFILALVGRFLNQAHIIEEANDQTMSTPSEYPIETLASAVNIDPKILSLIMDIYKTAGRVLYYVSASNWSTYYSKIKNAVHILGAMGEGSELNPPEIRLLECSCLTRQRIHTVFSGK